jgi:polyferredoxin/Tfp pilus assembly protein PilF
VTRSTGFDPGDPALPVAGRGVLSGVRKSRRSRLRAAVLLGVHLVILLHITHFLIAGRTLSPVEPSESMYTLELGRVNAGFIFFVVALCSTLLFGRFFCGWGCHLIALQDLCAWGMKRLGIRPRPFRSRLLLWGPLILALYMFVWPTVKRLLFAGSQTDFPGFSNHLMTTGFWETFPGPWFTVLTLVSAGFAMVYLLGSKGFCTYGCPYGALFGIADRLSVGRILVSDACDQCGHCTATCTSNVRVHQEVRDFGRVVDPGCMKCTDCISVCPRGALSFGFAWPSWRGLTRRGSARPAGELNWRQEILVAAVAGVATLAFRGLYDGPPLLMAIGLGAMTAFVTLQMTRLARQPDVRLQSLALRRAGRITPAGRVFAGFATVWLLFTVHSAFVQWHRWEGRRYLNATEATRQDVFSGAWRERRYTAEHERARRQMAYHFEMADRWGLAGTVEVNLGLAWDRLLGRDLTAAEDHLRQALALAPESATMWKDLFELSLMRGRADQALEAMQQQITFGHPGAEDYCRMAGLLATNERETEAVRFYLDCVERDPDSLEARYNLGGLLRRADRFDEAIAQLEYARDLASEDADTHVELGLAYAAIGRNDDAIRVLRRAIELAPSRPESRFYLPGLIRELE